MVFTDILENVWNIPERVFLKQINNSCPWEKGIGGGSELGIIFKPVELITVTVCLRVVSRHSSVHLRSAAVTCKLVMLRCPLLLTETLDLQHHAASRQRDGSALGSAGPSPLR